MNISEFIGSTRDKVGDSRNSAENSNIMDILNLVVKSYTEIVIRVNPDW